MFILSELCVIRTFSVLGVLKGPFAVLMLANFFLFSNITYVNSVVSYS